MTGSDQAWAEPMLEIDEHTERGSPIGVDQEIRVLARANRLAIRCDPATRHDGPAPGTQLLDFPLRCVAHAHPECRFRWVRVTLNVSETDGAHITDLSPRDEVSEHPVKVSTSYSGGLKFDIAALPVNPELSAERGTEQDVYFPKISVSGVGFGYAMWDFTAVGEEPLKVDRPLRLLAAVPAASSDIPVQLTIRALVTARGLAGRIPLIGRQNTTIPLETTSGVLSGKRDRGESGKPLSWRSTRGDQQRKNEAIVTGGHRRLPIGCDHFPDRYVMVCGCLTDRKWRGLEPSSATGIGMKSNRLANATDGVPGPLRSCWWFVLDGLSSGVITSGAALDPRLLAGRYRLDRVLGSGGTGTVWLGFDTQLTRAVAVKELRIPDTIDQVEKGELVERVMIEAQSAARIDHPNVVKVYDVLSEEGKPWLVMQLVHGQALEQKLRVGPLTIAKTVTIGLGVVEALAAAHALGIVHRDVKPANVMLADNGQVLLTDFSIAKVIGRPGITKDSDVWGTPGYVAPELVKNWTAGPPSDLFGLGVLLFRAVEGYGPFGRGDPQATMIASVTELHPLPAHAGPLAPVIDGLLEKDPMLRLTAQATRAALNAIARAEPTPALLRPVAPVTPASPRSGPAPLADSPSGRMPPVNPPSALVPSGPLPPNGTVKTNKPPRKFGIGTLSVTVTATVAVTIPLTLAFTHSAPSPNSIGPATSTQIPTIAPPVTRTNGPPSANPGPGASVTASPSSSTIFATQPNVRVNKAAIQSGDQVIINGTGFKPGEPVYIDLFAASGASVYAITKNPVTVRQNGDFGPIDAKITQGWMGPGDYSIVATGQTGDHQEASISIQAS